jgi:hypothetical protein
VSSLVPDGPRHVRRDGRVEKPRIDQEDPQMYASLLVFALAAPHAAPTPASPKWEDSYYAARTLGREQDKPLAVFIGSGPMGWKKFIDEGSLSEKARRTLADDYVCVYIDRDRAAGQQLAEQFDLPEGSGLVFSTRDGKGQAFFHAGKMSAAEFETRVSKYAATAVVSTTETLTDSRASFSYAPAAIAPAVPAPAVPAPAMMGQYPGNFGSFGGFGGGFGGASAGGGC